MNEVEIMKVNDLSIHDVANMNTEYTKEQYEALRNDIDVNGQLVPVLVYRGKIVDGRNRYKALTELGCDTIKCFKLPNNTTIEELHNVVDSSETRRQQTPTQLAVMAYKKMMRDKGCGKKTTIALAAKKYGSSSRSVELVGQIVKLGRQDIVDYMGSGDKINVGTANAPTYTDSLSSVVKWISRTKTVDRVEANAEDKDRELIVTEAEQIEINRILAIANRGTLDFAKKLQATLYYDCIRIREEKQEGE